MVEASETVFLRKIYFHTFLSGAIVLVEHRATDSETEKGNENDQEGCKDCLARRGHGKERK